MEEPLNSVPASAHTFLGRLFFIIFLNASAVVVAYFDFKGSTRR